jgi:hypothetical protein
MLCGFRAKSGWDSFECHEPSGFCGTRFAQTVLEAAYGILKSAKPL